MILVTTGGPDYQLTAQDYAILTALNTTYLYVGDCPTGADLDVAQWAYETLDSYRCRKFSADWERFGRAAGPERNKRMLQDAMETATRRYTVPLLLAFPGGKGTYDCVKQARKLGIPVICSWV